jgi:hypothetical protein
MTRSVWGDFTGDLRTDGVVLVGDRPVFLFNAGLHHALTDLPLPGSEIARLTRGAPDGRDALLVSSARGLELWWLNFESQSFASQNLGGSSWDHVRRLRSGDLFADGRQGVVGLRSSGKGFMLLPSPLDPSSEVSLATSYVVQDFVLLQWDGAPGLELAMLTSEGLKITDLGLVPLFQSPFGDDSDRLAVVQQPGKALERLALCIQLASGCWLFCFDKDQTDPGVFLGTVDLVDAVSADIDADGQHDFLLSQRTTGQLVLFFNRLEQNGQSFSTNAGAIELYDLTDDKTGSLPAPWNDGVPAFVDLDDDGDADVLHPVNQDKSIVLMRSSAIDHSQMVPVPTAGCYAHDELTGDTLVTLDFDPPSGALPVTPEILEIVVWRQSEAGMETDPIPLSKEYVLTSGWPLRVSMSLNETLPSLALHHVQVRLAKLAGPGSPRWAGPSYVYAMATSEESVEQIVEFFGVDPDDVLSLATTGMGLPCGQDPAQGFSRGGGSGAGTAQPGGGIIKPDPRGNQEDDDGKVPFTGDEGAASIPLSDVPCFSDGWVPWGL